MNDSGEAQISRETLAEHLVPLLEHYEVKWRGHGFIYVDHENYNITTAHRIVTDLSADLGVPGELIRARLVEFGWLNDVRSTLPVQRDGARVDDEFAPRSAEMPDENDHELNEDFGQD